MLFLVASAIATLLLFRWLKEVLWRLKHFPPGPWGLPVVGYLPWVKDEYWLTFQRLRDQYGGIFSVKIGGQTAVVLADWQAVKSTLVDRPQLFSGRPDHFTFTTGSKRASISFSDGPVWRKQRALALKCLRRVGMGRKDMEELALQPATSVVEMFNREAGRVVAIQDVFFSHYFNVVWRMVASRELVKDNPQDEAFEGMVSAIMDGMRATNPVNFLPWLRFAPPNGFGFWDFLKINEKVWKYLGEEIERHLAKWVPGQEVDFIDDYITAIKAHEEKPDAQPEAHLDYVHLTAMLWEFFVAGADTLTATSQWGLLYITTWPEIQRKAQQELDRVLGRDQMPRLEHFQSGQLSYVDALIMEIHRYASIVPLSLVHCPMETTEVLGYTIPKRTPCFQSIYSIHHDPQLWDQPQEFRPERFLDEQKRAKWPPYLMPYSIGPRLCLGETLAQQELRLMFSWLLHKFTFSFPPGQPTPSLQPQVSLVTKPQPYSLLIQLRH